MISKKVRHNFTNSKCTKPKAVKKKILHFPETPFKYYLYFLKIKKNKILLIIFLKLHLWVFVFFRGFLLLQFLEF